MNDKRAAYMREYLKTHRAEANAAWQRWHDKDPERAKIKAHLYYLERKRRRKRIRLVTSFSTRVTLRVGKKR